MWRDTRLVSGVTANPTTAYNARMSGIVRGLPAFAPRSRKSAHMAAATASAPSIVPWSTSSYFA